MRREWSGWIKNRQWGELERLAKTEPSQPLADTVAELERGFSEKADRRVLRKILFLLSQAGYRPQPIEETDEEPESPKAPREWGFLLSADAAGDAVVTYACESGDRIRWLIAHVNGEAGVIQAGEEENFSDAGLARLETLRRMEPKPYLSAEISPEFAKSRIAAALRGTRGAVPPTLAYWRSVLDRAEAVPHPAEALPRSHDEEAIAKLPLENDATMGWRLELGSAAPLVERLYELQRGGNLSEEELRKSVETARAEVIDKVFTQGLIDDHVQRLLDLGYLLHLKGNPGSDIVLGAADDLRERRAESPYAVSLLDKTLVILVESLRARPAPAVQ